MSRRPVAFAALMSLAAGAGFAWVVPADAAPVTVRVSATLRSGQTSPVSGTAVNMSTGKVTPLGAGSGGALTPGQYVIGAYLNEYPAMTVAARRVTVAKSTTVSFNAGKGKKVTFDVGDPTVSPVDLAVVPRVTIGGKERSFIPMAGLDWPAANTYVLPEAAASGVRLGIHGVLARSPETSPVRYDIARSFSGMPSAVAFKASKAQLARVELTVGTIDPEQTGRLSLIAKGKDLKPLTGVAVGMPVIGRQTSYRTANLQWGTEVAMSDLHASAYLSEAKKDKKLLYAAGRTYREEWGLGVWGPRPSTPAIFSQNGRLTVAGGPGICAFSGAGVKLTGCQLQPQTYSYTLARGSKSLGSGTAVQAAIDASKPQWYTATMAASRNGEGELATQVSSRWYFQAGGQYRKRIGDVIHVGENPVLPGYIRMRVGGADPRNRVAGGAKSSITMSVDSFGTIKTMTLKYSTDGGKTWKSATATKKGASWAAVVTAPKSGKVSLRARATDTAGAYVETTVVNAYGVR